MRIIFISIFLSALLISSASKANCSSVITGKHLIWKSDIIFEGTLSEVKGIPGDFGQTLTFQDNNFYKTDDSNNKTTLEIFNRNLGSDEWSSRIGKKYLVFSWLDREGNYGAYMCSIHFLDLENIKDKQINNNILDTLEALHNSYPDFNNPRAAKWLEERRNRRSFIENLLGKDL